MTISETKCINYYKIFKIYTHPTPITFKWIFNLISIGYYMRPTLSFFFSFKNHIHIHIHIHNILFIIKGNHRLIDVGLGLKLVPTTNMSVLIGLGYTSSVFFLFMSPFFFKNTYSYLYP